MIDTNFEKHCSTAREYTVDDSLAGWSIGIVYQWARDNGGSATHGTD